MKKNVFVLFYLLGLFCVVEAQTNTPVADLLDLKFSMENGKAKAQDISAKNLTVKPGGVTPSVMYDTSIRQYVSRFPQNTTSTNYFRVDYGNNTEFKNQIQESFTFEVYIKSDDNREMCPVGSMQYGGFGMKQLAGGATQFFIGKAKDGYHQIGSKNIYDNIRSEYCHIVYTYDGNNLKAYYNGVNTDNMPNVGKLRLSSDASSHWLAIGGDVGSSSVMERKFTGDIASVKMYSDVLSGTQISELYKQIGDRKSLSALDQLSKLVSKALPQQPNSASYLKEGWDLMNSLSTTEQDINAFKQKVEGQFGAITPKVSKYPRFAVMSDIHIGGPNDWKPKMTRAVDILKNQEEELDAIFIVGDVSNNGRTSQLKDAVNIFTPIVSDVPVYFSMGNHDWFEGNRESFQSVVGQRVNKFFEIKGYPFIMLSIDGGDQVDSYRSTSQNFMKAALEKANREYPEKPIFVYMHVPMTKTIYGSWKIDPGSLNRGKYTEAMKSICDQYPQIIVFTGHSHHPLGDERSIHQGAFTAIHDGGMSYGSIEDGLLDGSNDPWTQRLPPNYKEVTEGCIVSVDQSNDVSVKRMDFYRNEEIKTPWVIKAPHNGSMFTYTDARNGGEVPYFSPTDKISISSLNSSSFTLTFPQAKDDEGVHHYTIEIVDKDGKVIRKKNLFSGFFLNSEMPKTLSWTVTNLTKVYSDYEIRVTAVDSFYPNNLEYTTNKSKPLIGFVKDMACSNVYLIGSSFACGWNNTKAEAIAPDTSNEGIFVWSGLLKKGEFKLLLKSGAWDPSLNPTSAQTIQSGTSYDLNITNGGTGDYMFKVAKDMYCSLTVDTKNWTIKLVEEKVDLPLYLIGDAAPTGWDNKISQPLTKVSDGLFTWSGDLKVGHFKFITQLGTWNSIVPAVRANETIINGSTHRISDNYQGDYRFVLPKAGYYTITVDLNNNTMVVTKELDKISLYLVGDATPTGWDNKISQPLTKVSDGLFTWSGNLKAGHIKFITQLGTWNSIVPTTKSNETIINGFKHFVSENYLGDYRFVLPRAGYYTITVNMNNYTMILNEQPDNSHLYLVGGATPTGWDNKISQPLTKVSESVYTWTGNLKADHFKFITKLGTWDSLIPAFGSHETILIGREHSLTNEYKGDYRFVIPRAGEYKITVDLSERTLIVDDLPRGIRNITIDSDEKPFVTIADGRSVKVTSSVVLDNARLINMNGSVLDTEKTKTGTFYLGENLMDGVYLIEITYNGERVVQKIQIK